MISIAQQTKRSWMRIALVIALVLFVNRSLVAQVQIADMRPDAASPGMTIALELLAPVSLVNNFGLDGLAPASTTIVFETSSDSNRAIVGPIVTSWNGRLMQVPLIIVPSASIGPLAFHVKVGNKVSVSDTFWVVRAQAPISIFGGAILGSGSFAGNLTKGNTMVVQSINLSGDPGSIYLFSTVDSSGFGNRKYLPVTILSEGPVTIEGAHLSADADADANGGPGGGGGGHGNTGTGGSGYTGGGSDSLASFGNVGTGGNPTDSAGGISITGVLGGGTDSKEDQGGGGGTGAPFGTSGKSGAKSDTSRAGGYGGGSAGGELGQATAYGGGGGGFGTAGVNGGGVGANGGHINGGRFLTPLAGGSGGGAGNALNEVPGAGSGGGGGGALSIVSFSTINFKNDSISASGGNGTSGKSITAGGGGGSGGGVLVAARRGVTENNAKLATNGGRAGNGGANEFAGGAGGLGRIRIDGANFGCASCSRNGTETFGPSIDPIDTIVARTAVRLTGFSEDSVAVTDAIRIYYRTLHSQWNFIDTVRFVQNNHRIWRVSLPELHDSVIYAIAYAKVNAPHSSLFDQDPQWLVSHISIGRFSHKPLPFVRAAVDSLDFGCIKLGDCKTLTLPVTNLSEIRAHIDSIMIDDVANFASLASTPRTLASFVADSLQIQFCPKRVGKVRTILRIFSNDTTRTVILNACGLPLNDSIMIAPKTLDFGRVKVGACDTMNVTITAFGTDTSIVHLTKLLPPPFTWLNPLDSLILPPGRSKIVAVEFCPTDTGALRRVTSVNSDSVVLFGVGVRSILSFIDTLNLGAICLGQCVQRTLQLSNVGNDTLKVTGVKQIDSTIKFSPDVPIRILPNGSLALMVTACPKQVGSFHSRFTLVTSDSSYNLVVTGRATNLATKSPSLDFGIICADSMLDKIAALQNLSSDSIQVLSDSLSVGREFTIRTHASRLPIGEGDSSRTAVRFVSGLAGLFADTLLIHISNGVCDSTIRIPIHVVATKEPIAFSKSVIDFGDVKLDGCLTDSVLIANPCGPSVTLSPIAPSGAFRLISPLTTFTLASGESRMVVFRYCPVIVGADSELVRFAETSDTFRIALHGRGVSSQLVERAVFRVSNELMKAGSAQPISVSLDTLIVLTQLLSVSGELQYDPAVALPESISTPAGFVITGVESSPGKYDFTLTGTIIPGPLFKLQLFPLISAQAKTTVMITNVIVSPAIPHSEIAGSVAVIDCGNLAGNVSIAGDYLLHPLAPNPASGMIQVNFELGTPGTVSLDIFDECGARVASPLKAQSFSSGSQSVDINLTNLSSGFHYMEISSNGWRERRGFLIRK
jgi:hypothetical protein